MHEIKLDTVPIKYDMSATPSSICLDCTCSLLKTEPRCVKDVLVSSLEGNMIQQVNKPGVDLFWPPVFLVSCMALVKKPSDTFLQYFSTLQLIVNTCGGV